MSIRLARTILFFAMSTPLLLAAAPLPFMPAAEWIVRPQGENARVSLADAEGVLRMDFDITPDTQARSGHEVFFQGHADLLWKEPVVLPVDTERILFETKLAAPMHDTRVLLLPILRDEQGERFLFGALPFPHLKGPEEAWHGNMTPCFYAGEAGAPTQDVFEILDDPIDYAPTGALELLGFRLLLRQTDLRPEMDRRRQGMLALGEVSTCGAVIGYFHPYTYADALLGDRTAGEYRIASQILDAFQGVPVAERTETFAYNPANLASRKHRLVFELGPDGNYWIDYHVTAPDGAVAAAGTMRRQVLGNADAAPLRAVDTRTPPAIGVLRVNPDHAGRGVYARDEPAEIELRVFPEDGQALRIDWSVHPCGELLSDVLDSGAITLPADPAAKNGAPFFATVLHPATTADRDAYRLDVRVFDGETLVDSKAYFFGFRTDPAASHDRAGELVNRREVKKHPYHRTTYVGRGDVRTPWTEDEAVAHFRAYLAESRAIASSLTHMIDLRDFEVLPGVFDFSMLDRLLDAAADAGCKVTVRLAHCDNNGRNLYRWPTYSRQYAYDGTIAEGHPYYGAYSVLDPNTGKLWLDAYRALFNRYHAHTAFEGYYIMQPGGEWTVVDQPWNGTVTGYDPATAQGFRDWLRERHSLGELNRRWGTSLADFGEIRPPMPDFRGGAEPDLRMEWIDFCRFKDDLNAEWMRRAVRSIRTFDDDRVILSYGAPNLLAGVLGDQIDYGHNGGNHYGHDLGAYLDAWNHHRVGWITEPHHPYFWAAYGEVPNRGWVLDWSIWVMTAQAGGGGANLHVYYFPSGPRTEDLARVGTYGGIQAYDSFERFKPLLAELHDIELLAPPAQAAFVADPTTLYAKHRTTFNARLDDLRRWRELLENDSVPYEDYVPGHAPGYRLVLPNPLDEVIEGETLDRIVAAANAGAKVVLSANTGKFVPERGREPFALLRALGIDPPVRPFDRKGTGLFATALPGNPLFDEGAAIPFLTGDDFHEQLESAEVRARFWEYPYRWIPETDYFGRYPGVQVAEDGGAKVLARFADGGAALTSHPVGKGEALVFWGIPDMGMGGRNLRGMMARAATWAGIGNPLAGNPVRRYLEGRNRRLGRHYLVLYHPEPGTFAVPVPNVPDGDFFLDGAVCGERIGLYAGSVLRKHGLELAWQDGRSPLKVIRMIPEAKAKADWTRSYKVVLETGDDKTD